jgi:uncharacterized membrane protein YgaE (UPF0421/DUF939 family)
MELKKLILRMQMPLRASVAAVLSLAIAQALQLPFPLYGFISGVIVTDPDPAVSRQLGLRRVLATVIGAGCGAVMTHIVPANALGVGLGVLAAMLLAQLLKAGEGAKVAGYISGIVLLEHAAEPYSYAVLRFVETLVGVLVAWGISYVPKLATVEGKDPDDPRP